MFPVCEFVQSMVLNCISSVIDRTFFAVGTIVCFVSDDFCILCHLIFVFLHLLRFVFMQTKAFGFAFPRHRSHFTRELRRLPATRASTVNSPCEIRRQLHKYADANTIAQTYVYIDLSKYVIIIFAELREIACH